MILNNLTKRLRSDFTWVLCGNLLYSACQWGIIIAFARLGTPGQVGDYAFGMALCAPIVLFGTLQLRALVASDVNGQFGFSQYLAFRLLSLLMVFLAIVALALWTQGDRERAIVVVLIGFAQILESISETYYGWMQRHERLDRLAISLLLKGPVALGALTVTMYVTHNVAWAISALAAGRFVVLLAWDSDLRDVGPDSVSHRAAHWTSSDMLRLLRVAFPMGVIAMLVSLNGSIPRYFLEGHSGRTALGIFSAIASLVSAGTLVVSALGQTVFLPTAKAHAAADRALFRGFAIQAVLLGGALGGVAVLASSLFGRQILTFLFRAEYGTEASVLVWLMVAATVSFMASGLGYVITAARSLTPQIPLLTVTVLASAAVSAWAIPKYGLMGAAAASIVAASVQLLGTGFLLLRIDRKLGERTPAAHQQESEPQKAELAQDTAA